MFSPEAVIIGKVLVISLLAAVAFTFAYITYKDDHNG